MKNAILIASFFAGILSFAACQTPSKRNDQAETPSTTPPFRPFYIYNSASPRDTHYVPSGYMGDTDLTLSGAYVKNPKGDDGTCLRVNYKASGTQGWSGLYWQDPANNWGTVPGRAGYDLRGAEKVLFWARGENGGEKVQQFRMGGIAGGAYPDSDVASLGPIKLTSEWKQFSIDLHRKDLRHVIGAFGFTIVKADNPGGSTFYLSDIVYVGKDGLPLPTTASITAPVPSTPPATKSVVATPVVSTPVAAPPVEPPLSLENAKAKAKDLQVQETDSGLKVSFSSRFLFTTGRANLLSTSHKYLDQLSELLQTYPDNKVLVEGHTDSTGDKTFNLTLSKLRATNVRNYLLAKTGSLEGRFEVIGYGDTKPVADNKTVAGRALNRRVEVTILKSAPTPGTASKSPIPAEPPIKTSVDESSAATPSSPANGASLAQPKE